MREVRPEPVVRLNEPFEPVSFAHGEIVLRTATRAAQVNVLALRPPVVFRSGFEMSVRKDAEVLEKAERAIDSRGVDAGYAFSDSLGDHGGADVAL